MLIRRLIISIIILGNLFVAIQPTVFAQQTLGNGSSTSTYVVNESSSLHVTHIGEVSVSNLPRVSHPASGGMFVIPFHPKDPVSYAADKNHTEVVQSTTSFAKITAAPSTSAKITAAPSTSTQASSSPASITAYPQFDGINEGQSSCGCTPPDVQVAAGTSYVVEMVNTEEEIWTKTGTLVSSVSLSSFFGTGTDSISDPRILFDSLSGRWFASMLDITTNSVVIAISNTADPTAIWTLYSINFGNCADQPYIGLSDDKFVISGNDFGIGCNSPFQGAEYIVINKSSLLSGSPLTSSDYKFFGPNIGEFAVRPVQNLSSNSTLFMVSDDGTSSTNLYFYKIVGSTPNVSIQKITLQINPINNPLNALQKGTTVPLDTGDNRIEDAVWFKQRLWLTLNDGCTPSGDLQSRACVRLTELNTTTSSVLQDFDIAKPGFYFFYPSLSIDSNSALNVVFANSSANNYPSIMFTAQTLSDPANSVEPLQILKTGTAAVTFLSSQTGGIARYGDYFGSGVDPSNPAHVWMAGEYGSTASLWATHIGNTNAIPVANAGLNQTVTSGSTVTLNGIASSDSDGDSLSYSWTQAAGPAVTLSNSNSSTPSFVAPTVTSSTILTFKLVVSDGIVGSKPSTVSVTVNPPTCGVSLSQTTITYGTVKPGTTPVNATNNPADLSNTGSTTATLTVSAGNWTGGGSTVFILVNETAFATSPITSSVIPTHLNLHGNPVTILSNFVGMSTIQTYWQLIPKLFHTTTGTLTQSMTFATSC